MSSLPQESRRDLISILGNPVDALNSGTFSPGDLSSDDKVGNSCNTADCIFDSNRLVRDASESEVTEYVAKCTAVGMSRAPRDLDSLLILD